MQKILFSILLFLPLLGIGQISTDRPSQSESSSVIIPGAFQVETGTIVEFVENGKKNYVLPITAFRVGLTDKLEFRAFNRVLGDLVNDNFNFGIGDIELGFKYQIYQEEYSPFELALITQYSFPTGNKEFSNQYGILTNKLAYNYSFEGGLSLGGNLVHIYNTSGTQAFQYTAILGYSFLPNTSIFIEPYGNLQDSTFTQLINAGFAHTIGNYMQVDFSFGTGLNIESNYIGLGFSFVIIRNKEE